MVFDWYMAGLIGFIGLVVFIVGALLIKIDDRLERKREEEHEYYMQHELIPEVRKAVLNIMSHGMDMIPDKLKDIREKMEGDEEQTKIRI